MAGNLLENRLVFVSDTRWYSAAENSNTVEQDLIATEMLAFPSKPSRNKNDSDLVIAISLRGRQLLHKV